MYYTQSEVAKLLDIPQPNLSYWQKSGLMKIKGGKKYGEPYYYEVKHMFLAYVIHKLRVLNFPLSFVWKHLPSIQKDIEEKDNFLEEFDILIACRKYGYRWCEKEEELLKKMRQIGDCAAIIEMHQFKIRVLKSTAGSEWRDENGKTCERMMDLGRMMV